MNGERHMAKRWHYSGDINIEHGGLFWREDGAEDYVLAVQVTPCSDAGGPDNMFWVEAGSIYLPSDPERRKSALDCIGADSANPTRWELVEACHAYNGLEEDERRVVQIGRTANRACSGFGDLAPDNVLRANASLERFVRREFLR
jgi:hypothetical protein